MHLKAADGVQIAAASILFKNADPGTKWYGNPALEMGRGQRVAVLQAKLPEIVKEIRELRHELKELRGRLDPTPPVGATIPHLPDQAEEKTIDGTGNYYMPIVSDGETVYMVVEDPTAA